MGCNTGTLVAHTVEKKLQFVRFFSPSLILIVPQTIMKHNRYALDSATMEGIAVPATFINQPRAQRMFLDICAWAAREHPFYRQWLSKAAQAVPLLTRIDVLDNNEKLLNGHPVTARTSGSTGVPVEISWSQSRIELEGLAQERFIGWLGGRMNPVQLIHLAKTMRNGMHINRPVADQIAFLNERHIESGINAITTYPSNAERLCHAVIERQIDVSFIKRVGLIGEVFDSHQEALIRDAFSGAQIWSTYSSQELGLIAVRCPYNPSYHHVMAGKLGVEILNQANEPCSQGEVGRLVITDFYNRNSPLIRYDIGDLAAWGSCPCGKIDLPALATVLGKVRGALLHKNGERVPFTQLSESLRDIPGMRQYQVLQRGLSDFLVRLVHSDQQLSTALQAQVESAFLNHFGYLPRLVIQMEPIIEREANGKFYASICKV